MDAGTLINLRCVWKRPNALRTYRLLSILTSQLILIVIVDFNTDTQYCTILRSPKRQRETAFIAFVSDQCSLCLRMHYVKWHFVSAEFQHSPFCDEIHRRPQAERWRMRPELCCSALRKSGDVQPPSCVVPRWLHFSASHISLHSRRD